MRAFKSLLVMTAVAGLVVAMGARSSAGPIPVPLLDPKVAGPQLGESTLISKEISPGVFSYMEIDWMVVWDENLELYGYFYQVENRATNSEDNDVSSFTIRVPRYSVTPGTVFISTVDWDLTAPPMWLYGSHNVASEITEVGLGNSPTSGSGGGALGTVTWTWASGAQLKPGSETVVIGFYSPLPPVYGVGNLFDGNVVGGWGPDFNPLSQLIPVPSPEPVTAALMLMGVLGTGIFYRRRRS